MADDVLHRELYNSDVLANALNNGADRPLLKQLEGPTLSVRQVRDETSRYLQVLQGIGVGQASRVSLIASG